MSHPIELFQMAGWTAYAVLFLGVIAFVASLGALGVSGASKSTRIALAIAVSAIVVSFAPIGMGFVGYRLGVRITEQALANVDPEAAPALRARGEEEAFANVIIGGACTAFPLLLGLAAVGVALAKQRPSSRVAP